MTLIAILAATLLAGIGSVWVAAALLRLGVRGAPGDAGHGPQYLLSLAAGALLATAFMHLLPEAFESRIEPGVLFAVLLFGLVFFFHQVGGATGAWLGGVIFDRTGSYDLMWTIALLASVFAAVVHMPMRDGPRRAVLAPA